MNEPANVEVGFAREDELDSFLQAVATGFNDELSPDEAERHRRVVRADRSIVARDRGAIVGTSGSHPLRLTVPGGEVDAACVSGVTVQPTHRRRGLLRRMQRLQLDDVRERGEPVAALWASEGAIYPRFGYGLASLNGRIDAIRARMSLQDGERAGALRLVSHGEALAVLPSIYERVRPTRPGFLSRSVAWWETRILHDGPGQRQGGSPLFRAVLELDGTPEAYALYRINQAWAQGIPEGELRVQEAIATSARAHRELWRFLFSVDLVTRVRAPRIPVDDPLPLLVTEPTALRLSVGDGLYVRLVDVRAALAARGYAGDGRLTLEVVDEFCPWNAGVVTIEAEGGRADLRAGGEPELRLTAGDLASAYLGGFSFADLRRALRVEELLPGAVERADALVRSERAPFCPETF